MSTYYYLFAGAQYVQGYYKDWYTEAVLNSGKFPDDLTANLVGAAIKNPAGRLRKYYRRAQRGKYIFGLPTSKLFLPLGNMKQSTAQQLIHNKTGVPLDKIQIHSAQLVDQDHITPMKYAREHFQDVLPGGPKGWCDIGANRDIGDGTITSVFLNYDPSAYTPNPDPEINGILRSWATRCENEPIGKIKPYEILSAYKDTTNRRKVEYRYGKYNVITINYQDPITDRYSIRTVVQEILTGKLTTLEKLPLDAQIGVEITWVNADKRREQIYTNTILPAYGVSEPEAPISQMGNAFPAIPLRINYQWYDDYFPATTIKNINNQYKTVGLTTLPVFMEPISGASSKMAPADVEKIKDMFYFPAVMLYRQEHTHSYTFEFFKHILTIQPSVTKKVSKINLNRLVVSHDYLDVNMLFREITSEVITPLSYWDDPNVKKPKWTYVIEWEYPDGIDKDDCIKVIYACLPQTCTGAEADNGDCEPSWTVPDTIPGCPSEDSSAVILTKAGSHLYPSSCEATIVISKFDTVSLQINEKIRVKSLGFANKIESGGDHKYAGYWAAEIDYDRAVAKQEAEARGLEYDGKDPSDFPIPLLWYPFDNMDRKEVRKVASNFGFIITYGAWSKHVSWWVELRDDLIQIVIIVIQIYLIINGLGELAAAIQGGVMATVEYLIIYAIKTEVTKMVVEELGIENAAVAMILYGLYTGKLDLTSLKDIGKIAVTMSSAVISSKAEDLKAKLDKELAETQEEKDRKNEEAKTNKFYKNGKRFDVPYDIIMVETPDEFMSRTTDINVADKTFSQIDNYGTMSEDATFIT